MRSPRFLVSFLSAIFLASAFAAALAACTPNARGPYEPAPTSPPPPPPSSDSPTAPTTPPPAQPSAACIRTGCSGTVCTDPGKDVMTTCEMKPEYECYASAACERQANGACGFTQTPTLASCVANARK